MYADLQQDIALSEGVYTLTTLLRGRRGTEVFTGGHAVGDLFVLLGGDGVTRRPLSLDPSGGHASLPRGRSRR